MKAFRVIIIFVLLTISCSKSKEREFTESNGKQINDAEIFLSKVKIVKTNSEKKKNLDKAFINIIKQKNSQETRNILSKIIFEYYYLNDLENVNNTSKHLLKLSESTNDSTNLGIAYRSKAFYFKDRKILDSSFFYYFKSEKLYSKLNDRINLANVLLNKGTVQYDGGNNLGAELSLTRAQNIFNELKEKQKLFETLIALGNVSEELKEFDKSLIHYTKALEIAKELIFK